jgi:folate-binding Fe-S cluster repair protein YgfZ
MQGCYIGQETISKLAGLDGVKQQLWGLRLKGPVAAGSEVQRAEDGSRVGRVTSVAVTPSGEHAALAYIKCKSKGAQVNVEGKILTGKTQLYCSPQALDQP